MKSINASKEINKVRVDHHYRGLVSGTSRQRFNLGPNIGIEVIIFAGSKRLIGTLLSNSKNGG